MVNLKPYLVKIEMKCLSLSDKHRRDILLAGAYLFRRKSFLGTTLDDIALKVGINKATIYYYFENKEQILYEIMSKALDELIKGARTIVSTDASPMEKMESLVKLHLKVGTDSSSLAGVSQFERKNLSPKLLKLYNATRDEYEQIYRELLNEGMAMNQFQEGDPRMVARFMLGLVNSVITWFKRTGLLSIDKIGEEVWKFIFYSIKNLEKEGLSSENQ